MIDNVTYMFENGNDTAVHHGEIEHLIMVNEAPNEDFTRITVVSAPQRNPGRRCPSFDSTPILFAVV